MNPITARIGFLLQLAVFFGGLFGMIWLLHHLPDASDFQQRLDARLQQQIEPQP